MLVQANLADSGLTGSKDVCFGGSNLSQRKGNNAKRQCGDYFFYCYSQSQNNHLLPHLCTEIIPFKKVSEGHSYKKPRHNGRKQYESLLFHALWRKRGESSTVLSAQKGSSSHLFPIFAMPQPPALSQKHSLHSPAQWKTSLARIKAGQHNLQSGGENTSLGQEGRGGWGLIPLLETARNFYTECFAQRHFELGLVTGPRSLLTQAASVTEPQTYCVCSAQGPAGAFSRMTEM